MQLKKFNVYLSPFKFDKFELLQVSYKVSKLQADQNCSKFCIYNVN